MMKFLSILFLILILFFIFTYAISVPQCNPEDGAYLLQFKASFSIVTTQSQSFPCSEELHSTDIITWIASPNCCEWDGIACDEGAGRVIGLDLYCGGLEGTITSNNSPFSLAYLETLKLGFNDFMGSPILPEFGQFKNMTRLNLSGSNFTGEVPLEITSLAKMVSFTLSTSPGDGQERVMIRASTFEGLARNMVVLRELKFVNLNMSDVQPGVLTELSSSVTSLTLSSCLLEGELPQAAFGHFSKLQNLHLGGNNLNGHFPWSSLNFEYLSELDLSYNALSGKLPQIHYSNSSRNASSVLSLSSLFLSNNLFDGEIPLWIYKQSSLVSLSLENNLFTGELGEFRTPSLQHLSVGDNMLHGKIPNSIFQIDMLDFLDLSSNNLSNLEWLDLSYNELFGEIPSQLVDINWLSFLNLSYNNLLGLIPRGKQFDTFTNDSYSGNFGLCGFPLTKLCTSDEAGPDGQGSDGESKNGNILEWTVVMMGYASGLVIGVSIGYIVLYTPRFDYWLMDRVGEGIRRKMNAHSRVRRRN